MWTMECNDHGHGIPTLRPLLPRPIYTTTTTTKSSVFSTLPNSPCFRNPSFHSWKQHPLLGEVSNDYRKRVIHSMPLVSTRWNPTPEQLQALEEMYKRGTRTPTAQQIQQIAAKLRRFGKIEGKNVFYWFQNHKARERQKKRRQVELQANETKKRQVEANVEKKPTGLGTGYFDFEHPKKLPSTLSEGAECDKKEEWKFQQHVITKGKNETCWKLDLSSCNNTVQTITTQRTKGQESAEQSSALDHKLLLPSNNINDFNIIECGIKETQTLQLFPVTSIDMEELLHQDASMRLAPNEFIEFLPTKK